MKWKKEQLLKNLELKAENTSSPEDLLLLLKEILSWSSNYYDIGEIITTMYSNIQKDEMKVS